MNKFFNRIVNDLVEYIYSYQLQSLVLGISGGIDSTVVAAICKEACDLTGIPLIGRSLPIKNKNEEYAVSRLVGEAFCDDFKTCNLQSLYSKTLADIEYLEQRPIIAGDGDIIQTPVANGNIQARLRMIYLYNLAGLNKGIVMGTDNRTEYELGFWTLHGDVGDYYPIKLLWKTEVYELAEYLYNDFTHREDTISTSNAKKAQALRASINLTPTDGLGISNSDLEQIGAFSYKDVDDILVTLINYQYIPEAWHREYYKLSKIYTEPVVSKVWDRHIKSEFKRKHD